MALQAPPVDVAVRARARIEGASYGRLVWWRFRRHRLAIAGLAVLALLLLLSLLAEFVAPYGPHERSRAYTQGPPMGMHLVDVEGRFHFRPLVYARKSVRDPVTLRLDTVVDETEAWPVRFLVRGQPYSFWGLFESDIRLFGVPDGFIHLFGTDQLGRDVFSRVLHATRVSLSVGAVGVAFAFVLGLILGGVAGYLGGLVDEAIMRLIEFIRSIPTLPLWLALAAALPRDWTSLQVYLAITFILAFVGWTHLARRVRSKLLALRQEDYVLAARLSGCSHARIVVRHMLPAFLSYLIVDLTISFPYIILAETALSFLGLGLREPVVSWGVLLQSAQNIRSLVLMPWLLIPGGFVVVAVLAFNLVGDGLRDAADPYARVT